MDSLPPFRPLVEDTSMPLDTGERALKLCRMLVAVGREGAALESLSVLRDKAKSRERAEAAEAATKLLVRGAATAPAQELERWHDVDAGAQAAPAPHGRRLFAAPSNAAERALAAEALSVVAAAETTPSASPTCAASAEAEGAVDRAIAVVLDTPRCIFTWRALARILVHAAAAGVGNFAAEVTHIERCVVPALELRDRPCNAGRGLLRRATDVGHLLGHPQPEQLNCFWAATAARTEFRDAFLLRSGAAAFGPRQQAPMAAQAESVDAPPTDQGKQ